MEKGYKMQEVVEILKKGLSKEKGIKIIKILTTLFSIKRSYIEGIGGEVWTYLFKFNEDKYSDYSHNYDSPSQFLKGFYNQKLNFDEIKFPPADSIHQFIMLNMKGKFYLVLGFGNEKYIKTYELTKEKFLEFIEMIAVQNLNDLRTYCKKYPDSSRFYSEKCEFAEEVLLLIRNIKNAGNGAKKDDRY